MQIDRRSEDGPSHLQQNCTHSQRHTKACSTKRAQSVKQCFRNTTLRVAGQTLAQMIPISKHKLLLVLQQYKECIYVCVYNVLGTNWGQQTEFCLCKFSHS